MAAETSETSTTRKGIFPLDAFLVEKPQQASIAFFVLTALFAIFGGFHFIQFLNDGSGNPAFAAWAGALALAFFLAGMWLKVRQENERIKPRDEMRILILALGGIFGLVTFILGILLVLGPWKIYLLTPPIQETGEQSMTILESWKANYGRLLFVQIAIVSGLLLMFVSLKMARTAERTSPVLRRLFYGYNTAVAALLLIAILVVVNILCYVPVKPFDWLDKTVDWSPNQVYSLKPVSQNLLRSLDKQLRVYSLLHPGDLAAVELRRLLEVSQEFNNDLQFRMIDPFSDIQTRNKIIRDFQIPTEELANFQGRWTGTVVVAYGTGDNIQHELVKRSDLTDNPDPTAKDEPSQFTFTGEKALMSAIRKLSQGSKAKIYFTQNHGELDIDNTGMLLEGQGGMGLLKRALEEKGSYEIARLNLGPGGEDKVPDDAAVVVIAAPRTPFAPKTVDLLRDYLNRQQKQDGEKVTVTQGKLVILLDVITRKNSMIDNGLAGLLREHQVQVGNERILSVPRFRGQTPQVIVAIANPRSQNPIAREFSRGMSQTGFRFDESRKVEPMESGGPRGGAFRTETLLFALSSGGVWEERNLTDDPQTILASYVQRDVQLLRNKLTAQLPVAVTVTSTSMDRPTPTHAPIPGKASPRMVVFGDATWVSNDSLPPGRNPEHVDLFASCLAWLIERPDIGVDVPASARKTFTLRDKYRGSGFQLFVLPALMILLSVIALGGGIWIARRR